ncbi:MAG: peptidase S16 [Betaproteobacteria bacterium]|nr:peptidase S16 [Betaproteobacteria bacterium]
MATNRMSIPLFPLGAGLYPDGLLALRIFEVRYLDMVKRCLKDKAPFGVVRLEQGSEVRKPGVTEKFSVVGTVAEILEADALQPALLLLRCRGTERFRVVTCAPGKYGLWMAEVETIEADAAEEIPWELQSAADKLGQVIAGLQKQGVVDEQMPILRPYRLDECGWVANRWAEMLPLAASVKQSLLEEERPKERLRRVLQAMDEMLGR